MILPFDQPKAPRSLHGNRSVLLDCIRAVAIISVVTFHVGKRYDPATLDPVAALAERFGLLGVDVFFPLSGFLITRYLYKSYTSRQVNMFFVHRFLRIVPLYLVAVTAYLAASLVLGYDRDNADRIWIAYTFLTGWFIFFDGVDRVPFTITWSLSVEVFAYTLFGIFAWISRRRLLLFLVASTIVTLLVRLYLEINLHSGIYNFPLARLDSIAIGGIVAVLMQEGRRTMPILALTAGGIYCLAMSDPLLWAVLKYSFIAIGTCFFIVLSEERLSHVSSRALYLFSTIGFYSYFTYLFHLFNIHFLMAAWEHSAPGTTPPFWPLVAVSLLVTQVQAILSFRYFEGPLIRYGRMLDAPAARSSDPVLGAREHRL